MDEMAVRRMEVPNAVLLGQVKEAIREGHTATINVKGYSMRPFLEHCRDKVRLASFTDLKVGDAVLAEFSPDKYVLHRIIEIDGDVVVMMGDGNLRHKEICCKEDIVGIVTHYIRRGKTIPASDPRLQRRVRMWHKLLPVRRYLLYIYRINGMDNIDFSKIISLNETAAFLWKEAVGKEEISEEELTATLLEAYEVDEETARKDVAQVLAKWGEIGLLA